MIKSVIILLVYALQLQEFMHEFIVLGERVLKLMNKSGTICTINYLKECTRILIRWLAKQEYEVSRIPVKRSRSGLPMIIPGKLRYQIQLLRSGQDTRIPILIIRGVLSALQLWRAMKVKGLKPKFGTITDAFTGTIETIKFRSSYLPKVKWKRTGTKWFISQTSGPNSPFATYGMVLDAFAFTTKPKEAYYLIMLM